MMKEDKEAELEKNNYAHFFHISSNHDTHVAVSVRSILMVSQVKHSRLLGGGGCGQRGLLLVAMSIVIFATSKNTS